jgi:hypothetical protein
MPESLLYHGKVTLVIRVILFDPARYPSVTRPRASAIHPPGISVTVFQPGGQPPPAVNPVTSPVRAS